jgi:hypothetical protein
MLACLLRVLPVAEEIQRVEAVFTLGGSGERAVVLCGDVFAGQIAIGRLVDRVGSRWPAWVGMAGTLAVVPGLEK